MADRESKNSMFKAINTRKESLKVIRETSTGFILIALLNGSIGFFLSPSMVIDGIILLVLGLLLKYTKSRVVSILILLIGSFGAWFTIQNNINQVSNRGTNVILSLVLFWASVKAVEATFKLHGRFAEKKENGPD